MSVERRRGGNVDSVAYACHRGGGFKREIITRGRARDAGVSHALRYCKRVARTRARVLSSRGLFDAEKKRPIAEREGRINRSNEIRQCREFCWRAIYSDV